MNRKFLTFAFSIFSIIGYGVFVFAAGPFDAGETLDPVLDFPVDCSGPSDTDCYVTPGWLMTGNAGTDDTVNFIGTTDAEDFVIKTNSVQVAKFGQDGNVAIGGGFGWTTPVASGAGSFVIGNNSTASGDSSYVFGENLTAPSGAEIVLGTGNSTYTPVTTTGFSNFDRLFTIGNGSSHNAYTMWKDGSFVYNDDDFAIDAPGTEQNMFYFNYGNHDGLGEVQTKKAIRLGSAKNSEWDIDDALVGDSSIAVGFADSMYGAPKASGLRSVSLGNSQATGDFSNAFGHYGIASGQSAFVFGNGLASGHTSYALSDSTASGAASIAMQGVASGLGATAIRGNASGDFSYGLGHGVEAFSSYETVLGLNSTTYTPTETNTDIYPTDRLFTIGNGDASTDDTTSMGVWDDTSDAFTILKNGQVGIAIDNYEANNTGNLFELGDGGTSVIAAFDGINWMTVSDERKKKNIQDLAYGLDTINQLRPVSFDYKRNDAHTIGFLAQQVLPYIPESVGGSEEDGYSMSYSTIIPVTVKAIQELDLKIENIESIATMQNETFVQNLIAWLGDALNGLTAIHVDQQLCIGATCINESDLQSFKSWQGTQNQGSQNPSGGSNPAPNTPQDPDPNPDPAPVPDTDPAPDPIPETDPDPSPEPEPSGDPVPVI